MNAEMMTLPRPLVKEVIGSITYVGNFNRILYSQNLFVHIFKF